MFNSDFALAPYKMAAANLAFWADMTKATQKRMVDTAVRAAEQMPDMLTWEPGKLPSMTSGLDMSEAKMREAFQSAADSNLNVWTHAASMLSAMPDWVHWPSQIPGRTMTDMFDQFKTPPKHNGSK